MDAKESEAKRVLPGDRLNRVIADYIGVSRKSKRDIDSLVSIITRYNAPWDLQEAGEYTVGHLPGTLTSLACEGGISCIKDIASHPFFYRLNFIKQLGLVHLFTNLDGSHNRLAHCIGTAQCAARFLQALRNQNGLNLQPVEEYAVLIGAFIHDSYHGPFGHSLEMLRDVFLGETKYRRLDKFYLLDAIRDDKSALGIVLERALPTDWRDVVLQYLEFFCDRNRLLESDDAWGEKYYLAQIIDSDFDADRIDFVIRDSKHLGLGPVREEEKLYNVVESVRALPIRTDNDLPNSRECKVLCFSKEYRTIVDEFLARRRDLYLEYYENPKKLILDDMLAHVVYYVLEAKQATFEWWPPHERKQVGNFLSQLHRLTDDGLIHFIYEVSGDDPKSAYALQLLNDLLGNRPFIEIAREEVGVSKARQIHQQWKSVDDDFEKLRRETLRKKSGIPAGLLGPQEQFEILSTVLNEKPLEITLLYFARLFSGGFLNKLRAERKLWSLLLGDDDFNEVFKNYLSTRFRQVNEQLTNVGDIPHIHITLPTYAAASDREILEYTTEPATVERIAFYQDDHAELLSQDLPRREDLKKPIVVLSTCEFLAADEPTKQMIISVFRKFLYTDRNWLDLQWLQ